VAVTGAATPAPPPTRPVVVSLRASGLGDLCTVVPALRGVRRAFPDATHLLAAPAALWPLARATGAVDGLLDVRGLEQPIPYRGRVDVAIDLHGCGPESHRLLLDLGPLRLLAHSNGTVPYTGPSWVEELHDVRRWCDLLVQFGIPCDTGDLGLEPPDEEPVPGTRRATVIHAGAGAPDRVWPFERWAAVAREELANGHRVVLTGSPAERTLAEAIADATGRSGVLVLAGETDLSALMRVVAHAGRVLSSDTGVAHLAYAFGIPSVTLFGPMAPRYWGPPPSGPHVALWTGAGRSRPGNDGGSDAGLLGIEVIDVLLAVRHLPVGVLPLHIGTGTTARAAASA
jgi:ADP-heptose:LPS heptosyltransferase